MNNVQKILEVHDIIKTYAGIPVLNGVSLTLEKGQSKVIMGPSGTGKSTLLRCINHLNPPDSGRVILGGEMLTEKNLDSIRQRLAFVFQDFNLFSHLTVLQNVAIGPHKVLGRPRREAEELAMDMLAKVGMNARADYYPAQLSGGQQQRVSIARALAMEPQVILFDEPTSALDPELKTEVVNVMKQLASDGLTMLVVSHEMAFARAAADEVIFMEGGKVVEQGPPGEMFSQSEHATVLRFLNAASS
ncbi:ATP-binding cassette domain-containing protein [Pseudomonas sp. NPDC008258]|uniref:amino acid ABC transporter ATP-binding protein n=1 Tax=Pseudomonas sp. NPDC008258 TaxID=3364418 RepID=UPI0036EDAFA2